MPDQDDMTEVESLVTAGVDEDPEQVAGDAVDEADVLGEWAPLAEPAAHQQDGDA